MTLRLAATLAFVLLPAFVSGCGTPPASHEAPASPKAAHGSEDHTSQHDHDDQGDHDEAEAGGALHLEGLRGVSFSPVGEPREEGAWFAAEAASDTSAETLLTSPVSGIVTGLRIAPGATAKRGGTVVEIRSPELADLAARWRSAVARAERAQREAEREQRLLDRQATAARDAENARTEAVAAEAEATAARAALEARGVAPESSSSTFLVRAPHTGILANYTVSLGESVAGGATLGTWITPGAALVKVELPLPGPASWQPGSETEVRRADGQRWQAKVEGTPPRLAPDSRRLAYFLRLTSGEPHQRPLTGTPLEVRVPLARAIVLPQTALQQIEGVWGVFVRLEDEAEFRPVRKGAELGGDVLVLEGVAPGETVATDGAYLLKALWLKRQGGGEDHDH
jgi:cobalt-zinc-cadmium efflux system membrane fusion protein